MTFELENGVYVSQQGTGETLATDFSSGLHTLTLRDGTQVILKESYVTAGQSYYGSADALGEKIIRPDGHETTLHYETQYYEEYVGYWLSVYVVRLSSVTTNTSYQLLFEYASGNPAVPDDWYEISKVTAVNNSVDYCPTNGAACTFSQTWPSLTYSTSASGTDTLETVTDVLSRETRYRTDSSDRLTGIKRPEDTNDGIVYTYDNDDRVTSVVNQGNYTRSYSWAETTSELTATANDSLGREVVTTTDITSGLLLSTEDALGNLTQFDYDSEGRITSVEAEEGNKIEYDYDDRGNVTQVTRIDKSGLSANDIVSTASYPTSCTNPMTCNKPTSTTDANGNVTDYTYSATHGGLTKVELPADENGDRPTTEISYTTHYARKRNSGGTLVQETNGVVLATGTRQCRTNETCYDTANERMVALEFDNTISANLNPTRRVIRAGNETLHNVVDLTYTPLGRIATADGPVLGTGDTTSYHYDLAGQVIGVISPDPDGGGSLDRLATRMTYNQDGQVTLTENGYTSGTGLSDLNSMTVDTAVETTYDEFGRTETSAQIAPGGTTVYSLMQYGYDAAGRPTCTALRMNVSSTATTLPTDACVGMTPTSGNEDRISMRVYDAADRVTELWAGVDTDYQHQSAALSYNGNGTVAWVEDGEDFRTTYTYDDHDRLIRTQFPDPDNTSTSLFSDREELTYDDNGNVLTLRTRAGETFNFAYDDLNRLIEKDVPARTGIATHTRDVHYEYDLLDSLLEARFDNASFGSTGDRIAFAYDALGRPVTATQIMDGNMRAIGYQYDNAGRRTRITHPDGPYWTYNYDTLSRLSSIVDDDSITLITNQYGDAGRLTGQTREGSAPDETYTYDAAKRLDGIALDHTSSSYDVDRDYTYNSASQAQSESISNQLYVWDNHPGGSTDADYTPDGLNRYEDVDGTSFTYDANGNLTSDGTTTYTYDTENRLIAASGGNTADLRYDPLGRLYEIEDGSANIERLLYDGQDLILEYNGTGARLRRYVHGVGGGDNALIHYEGVSTGRSNAAYLYTDRIGSVVASFVRSGAVRAINSYDEFGVPGFASGTQNNGRFRYTGQIYIPALGQYHYKARAYSPGLGRFMQTDPIGYGDGLNMYAYVRNDPVNAVDPTGLCSWVTTTWWWVPEIDGKPAPEKAYPYDWETDFLGCKFGVPEERGFNGEGGGANLGKADGGTAPSSPIPTMLPCVTALAAAKGANGQLLPELQFISHTSQVGNPFGPRHPIEYGVLGGFDSSGNLILSSHFSSGDQDSVDRKLIQGNRRAFERAYGIPATVFFHTHPNLGPPSPVSSGDVRFANDSGLTTVAIDKAQNLSCTTGS